MKPGWSTKAQQPLLLLNQSYPKTVQVQEKDARPRRQDPSVVAVRRDDDRKQMIFESTGKSKHSAAAGFEHKHLEALDDLATSCHKRYVVFRQLSEPENAGCVCLCRQGKPFENWLGFFLF